MIDSLRLFEQLKSADLPERQAKTIAQAIGDVAQERESRHDKALADKVNNDKFEAVIDRIEQRLERIEQRLDRLPDRSEVASSVAEAKSELLRWMFGFWVGQVGATIALVKLLR